MRGDEDPDFSHERTWAPPIAMRTNGMIDPSPRTPDDFEIAGPGERFAGEADDHDEAAKARSVKRGFWSTMKRAARVVPLGEDVVAAYYCAFDRQTPQRVRLTLIAALGYFVLPLDSIPDFVVGLGFTDDVAVLMTAIATVSAHIRPEHRRAAQQALDEGDRPS